MRNAVQQLNDPEYANFIAVGRALTILCEGLRFYTEEKAKELQDFLLKSLGGYCNCMCTVGAKPCRHTCKWSNNLERLHVNRKIKKNCVRFYQSDHTLWHDPSRGYWEIAKIFMHDLGANWHNVKDPATTDLTGNLNFLIFYKHSKVNQKLLKAVRELRNDLSRYLCRSSAQQILDYIN